VPSHREDVNVILDHHNITRLEVRVQSPGGVGDNQRIDSQQAHHANGQRHFGHRIAFVEVRAALHRQHRAPLKLADYQLPGVPQHGRARPVRNVGVGDHVCIGDLIHQRPQAGAEDQADGGLLTGALAHGVGSFAIMVQRDSQRRVHKSLLKSARAQASCPSIVTLDAARDS